MRIVFASTAGAGHVGPLVPFARACARAGHDVLVAAPESAAALVRRAGLAHAPVGEPRAEVRDAAWAPVWSPDTAPGAEYVIQELFVGLQARAALPAMLRLIGGWRADLVVRETCEFSSAVAAEWLGVPQVRIGVHLSSQIDAGDGLVALSAPAVDALRVVAGLAPDPAVSVLRRSPVLTLAPRALDDPAPPARVRRFRLPEPSPVAEPLPDWGDRAELPLVYVSYGSEASRSDWFPALYRASLDALADLPVRALVTIGDRRDPAELGPLPPNARVERWVAQAAVMPQAAAMVGHGGSGSTLSALAAGVPLALVPLFVDGPANATRVAAAGAGLALSPGMAGAAELAGAVETLLGDPGYGVAADRIAGDVRALPPVDDAVGLLVAAAAAGALAA